MAHDLIRNNEKALETLAREELGVDPKELGGSPMEAALTSFGLFALGAIVPVAPFFFASDLPAVLLSLFSSAAGLS